MLIWSLVLFALGILAFLDSQFNYGYLFRTANSVVFMLVSLGILIRTRRLAKWGFREQLIENNDELRARMLAMRDLKISVENEKPDKRMVV
ncbi:MAG: hypothetical protein A2W25_04445 [candidate division Zixibacteria bacterium RBG_16_53_22]|nr:MAG: hypothetical protein A2W25_04445 [candidate division Zixibacteria bacterium RBG_16_53_22]